MRNRSRRQFLAAGAGAVCAAPIVAAAPSLSALQAAEPQQTGTAHDPVRDVLDYARSFVTFVVKDQFNFARLQIEARCLLLDKQGKVQEIFHRYASCKWEDTHAAKNLFQDPNFDFSGVFSPEHYAIFRVRAPQSGVYDQRGKVKDFFEDLLFDLRYEPSPEPLKTNSDIVRATRAGLPMVGRTEIADEPGGRRAILEYPIKTMNVNLKRQIYQVDTGPLAFPDFPARAERPIDMIHLAFVAHNRPDEAYFVIQRLTPLSKEGGKAVAIYHYSENVRLPARNTLYAVR